MPINVLKKNSVKVFVVCIRNLRTQINAVVLTKPVICALNWIYFICKATNKLNDKFIDLTNGKENSW